jgi:hypothetical protein
MSYKIEYWTNAPDEMFPTVLVVSPTKGADLLVSSNEDDPRESTIGRFSMSGNTAAFAPLLEAVLDPSFAAVGEPASALPGELIRRFSVTAEGNPEIVRIVTETMKPDAAFSSAEDVALQLVQEVRKHPRRALALENFALKFSSSGQEGDHLEVAFNLANPGTEPVAIPRPERWSEANIQLTITARRSDVPLEKMGNQHQVFVQLEAGDLVGLVPPAGKGDLLLIDPGQDLALRFQKTLSPLPAGKYDTWGVFSVQLLDARGTEITQGELSSPHQPAQRW